MSSAKQKLLYLSASYIEETVIIPLKTHAAMLSLLLSSALIGTAVSQAPCHIPSQAQVIDARRSLVLNNVLPPAEFNATNVRLCQTSEGRHRELNYK
jgi:hypothetical protein